MSMIALQETRIKCQSTLVLYRACHVYLDNQFIEGGELD